LQTMNRVEENEKLFFGWIDYVLFIITLVVSTMIGIYFGFWGKKEETPREYLHGGKTMNSFPVAVSLVSCSISGITLMGVPTEIYRFGTVYSLVVVCSLIMVFIVNYFYLPVFFDLQLTSSYEYLELRFDNKVRVMGSILFSLYVIILIPMVVYVPAISLNQVSGVNLHVITVVTSILCIFYTMIGGLKAVVWTDFLQGLLMVLSNIAVIVIGVIHAGGFVNIWRINQEGGRIQLFEMNPSPFIRQSFWTLIFGFTISWIYIFGVSQNSVQKFISLPTFSHARRSLILSAVGLALVQFISCVTGVLIYSAYSKCDPIQTKAVSRPDQLTTYYVMDIAGNIQGLPGLFVAGIFSAALSSMSSMLNSLGATLFEDFVRPCIKRTPNDKTINTIIKCIVILTGLACLLLVFLVDKFESILQVGIGIALTTGGTMLGLFTFGMFYPKGNAKGALAGSIVSLLTVGWIAFGAQTAIANGSFKQPYLPNSVEGCESNVTLQESVINEKEQSGPFILYQLSYMYYSTAGVIIMMVVGILVSCFTEPPDLDKINPNLFTPVIRKFFSVTQENDILHYKIIYFRIFYLIRDDAKMNARDVISNSSVNVVDQEGGTLLIQSVAKIVTMNFTDGVTGNPQLLFGWLDFVFFLIMLAVSTLIGIYFGFCGKKEETPKEYLHGGKTMSTLPVAVSLVSSSISGITLMGVPTEIYRFGTIYSLVIVCAFTMGIINNYFYLPVFYELQLTSTYEYFELRYNHKIRVIGSILYTINLLLIIPIVVYVPALVFSQVSGINLHFITVGTSILCIFYTMIGGLKAVVWTDFLQGVVMVVSNIVIIVIGVVHAGGIENVWRINKEGGRIYFFDMNPSPFARLTFWTIIIGFTFVWVNGVGVNQAMVQKFMSLPTLKEARKSLLFCSLGLAIVKCISCVTGILIYSAYHDCDPIESKAINRPDQLATYYVLKIAGHIPGLPGLFVAGIFSAALSSMSSMLNSLGATLFEDFVRPCIKKSVTDETINKMIKCVVVAIGSVCLLLVFIVDKFGSVLQLATSMVGVTAGATLGLFTFGMFYPRGNTTGALAGSIASLLIVGWIAIGAQTSIASGQFKQPYLPTSVEGCKSNVTLQQPTMVIQKYGYTLMMNEEDLEEPFILYQLSFMYYTIVGLIIMLVVGAIVSHFTEPPELTKMSPKLFTPIVRKYVIRKQEEMKKDAVQRELLKIVRT
ncbi:hypothetical protein L9F63_007572, partial [Diploptera punctata]